MDNGADAPHICTMDSDIIITGGGLNGGSLALALASAGFSVTLIDRLAPDTRKMPEFDGRSYALALASKRLIAALGLWDELAENAQPMLEIKVTDGRAGEGPSPFMMHFDHAEIEEGPMGFMVQDRHLRHTLLDAIAAKPQITQINATVTDQQMDALAQVTLDTGQTLSAALMIGADGRGSGTAKRAGITRNLKDYGQTAVVAAIGHERAHNGVAHQFFMPAGPLAILPLTGNRSSIVWAETHARAAELDTMNDTDFLTALRPAFGDFLGPLSIAGARYTYPLNQTITDRLTDTRLALIGDAAHGVHPIAGQGLNQGLRDVAALAETLADAKRRGEDIGSAAVLERYAAWRRFDVRTLAMATDKFNALFSNDNPLIRAGRGLGMGLINTIPAVRRAFIREAAGLTGDLPRLMRGQRL